MERKLDLLPVGEWGIFPERRPMVIAGPCSAETEKQVIETAEELRKLDVGVFRAGIWKPRTHPNTFEGVGSAGLGWLRRVHDELGLKVCTEVACREHVQECLDNGIDMVWIGARTTASPFLVQEIADACAGQDLPVLVKNPVSPDIGLWTGAIERLSQAGVKKIGVVLRGFSSLEHIRYRNSPGWKVAIEMRSMFPGIPFFCDPSHMAGDRKYLYEISQRALDLGLDGLMIESHCCPSCALSDAGQQLSPEDLGRLLENLSARRPDSDSPEYRESIEQLRARIDVIDESILAALGERMEVSRKIGEYKKKNNIAIIQASRWDTVLDRVRSIGAGYGLDPDFVEALYNTVHEASVRSQNDPDRVTPAPEE